MAKRDIQTELSELRYYYSRRKYIDEYASIIGKSKIVELAEIYQTAICQAPIRLYDLFAELYVNNLTWESVADKWSYSTTHIGRQAKELIDYLTVYFEKHQPLPAKGGELKVSVEELKNFEDMLTCGEDNQNVYRTEEYVVIQRICFSHNSIGQALTISHDYYFC